MIIPKTIPSGSKHFSFQQLDEGIFAAIAEEDGAAVSNSGVIDLGGQIVVFDTFLTPQAALDLRRLAEETCGRTPQIVVNSHYHNDHIWGNQVFAPDAQIIASEGTRQLMLTAGKEELQWYTANSAQKLASLQSQYQQAGDADSRRKLEMWIGYYAGLVEALPDLRVCMPGITFTGRLAIHGSHRTAKLATFEGGHTGSDTVLHLPEDGIVFMSDLLFVGCHPYLADGDPDRLLDALKELRRLDAACFVPGHGPVGTARDLELLAEYIETCMETARMLVKEGNAAKERIAGLKVADAYAQWQFPQFFQANIQFLCQRLKAAGGEKHE